MRRYDVHERAIGDILDLSEYISDYSEKAGDALIDDVFTCFEQLSEFPHLGRERRELGVELRSFALNRRRLTIFYYAQPEQRHRVLIARVLRQERSAGDVAFD